MTKLRRQRFPTVASHRSCGDRSSKRPGFIENQAPMATKSPIAGSGGGVHGRSEIGGGANDQAPAVCHSQVRTPTET